LPEGKDLVDVQVGELGRLLTLQSSEKKSKRFHRHSHFREIKDMSATLKLGRRIKAKKSRAGRGKEARKQSFIFPTYFVEHLIRLIKLFRVAKERFRLDALKYKLVILTICGLVRLRIGALNLSVENLREMALP
jgi:hypothetical protein